MPMFFPRLPEAPQPATVDTPTAVFMRQHYDLRPCHDLMGGTEAMRRAGSAYIPKEDGESPRNHDARIARTVLRNVFRQTVQYNRGQVFSRTVALDNTGEVLTDEQMQTFNEWQENVDQRGKNLTSWAGDVFQQGLVDGVTFCFVDFPSVATESQGDGALYQNANGEWKPLTVAAVEQEGWTPYFVHIPASQVLDCRAEWRDGRHVITHFRYLEITIEDDPANQWGQNIVQYVHAYWVDRWELWRKRESEAAFVMINSGNLTLDEIPLAVFMPGDKRTDFTAQPALMDLAWLNIRHWQATCEQYDLMSFVRRPPWYVIGVDIDSSDANGQAKPAVFGPGHVLYLPQGGGIGSAGVDPGSVEAGRSELKDLETAMAAYGLQLLQPATAALTATQINRESRESNSQLKNWALDFQDFLENCLRFVALWWGYPDGPSAKVNDEFAATANIDYLFQLHDKGLISKETLAVLMMRAGVLPDDFSYEKEIARLAQDVATVANAGPSFGLSLAQRLGVGAGGDSSGNSGTIRGIQGRSMTGA